MALSTAFTTENTVVTVNGRMISDWGTEDTPINEENIDPKRVLVRGLGGSAAVLERKNAGKRVTLNLMVGSADSAFMQGLFLSGATITYTRSQIGAIDGCVCSEGVIVTENPVSRGGASSQGSDTYVMEFNVSASSRGGEAI